MGVWPDGYYKPSTCSTATRFGGAKLCAYDRTAMLAGSRHAALLPASTSYGGVLPADLDGSHRAARRLAELPDQLRHRTRSTCGSSTSTGATPANTTFTGPTNIPVAAFAAACSGGTCIPQSGTDQQLDSLADRLMYRLAYRNFGNHESLVVNHSVQVGTARKNPYRACAGTKSATRAARRTVYPAVDLRAGHHLSLDGHRSRWTSRATWRSATARPAARSIPSIRYTGRLASDPLNTMQAREHASSNGTGSQSGSDLNRWGDYSAMTIDPVDDCTFWYTTEYLKTTGTFNWSTRIASFKFPSCQ